MARPILPGSGEPRKGGPAYHKAGCKCNPCRARSRAEETLTVSSGAGRGPLVATKPEDVEFSDIIYVDEYPSLKSRMAQWIALRAEFPDITQAEAARRMGIAPQTLNNQITQATQQGWLKFIDPLARIEHEVVPKVLDNLNYYLDQRDKTVTLETAKGTVFKTFQESKGISDAPKTVLALKIEMPDSSESTVVASGTVVGVPRTFED